MKAKTGLGASYANARGLNATYLDRNGRVVRPKGSRGYSKTPKRVESAPSAPRRSFRSLMAEARLAYDAR